jgi:hypothetical protein
VTSLYNPYLLITAKKEAFRVVSMQTDNTLFLAFKKFAILKDSKLSKAHLTAKLRNKLSVQSNLIFNGYIVIIKFNSTIYLT